MGHAATRKGGGGGGGADGLATPFLAPPLPEGLPACHAGPLACNAGLPAWPLSVTWGEAWVEALPACFPLPAAIDAW